MTDRRQFLQGATLSALSVATGLPGLTQAHDRVSLPFGAALIDERHAESLAFGARLAARGAVVRALPDGDITQLWLNEIGPAWKRGAMALAGLTRRPVLFCLEQLAWTYGLRVVFHAEHIVDRDGTAQHEVLRCVDSGAGSVVASELARSGARWPGGAAHVVAEQSRLPQRARMGPTCASLEPRLPPDAQLLTSWIIAAAR